MLKLESHCDVTLKSRTVCADLPAHTFIIRHCQPAENTGCFSLKDSPLVRRAWTT